MNREKVMKLAALMEQHPDLEVIPIVDEEVVGIEDFTWWTASMGRVQIEELYDDDDHEYIRSESEEYLVERKANTLKFADNVPEEEAIRLANEAVNQYPWRKVIAVRIVV